MPHSWTWALLEVREYIMDTDPYNEGYRWIGPLLIFIGIGPCSFLIESSCGYLTHSKAGNIYTACYPALKTASLIYKLRDRDICPWVDLEISKPTPVTHFLQHTYFNEDKLLSPSEYYHSLMTKFNYMNVWIFTRCQGSVEGSLCELSHTSKFLLDAWPHMECHSTRLWVTFLPRVPPEDGPWLVFLFSSGLTQFQKLNSWLWDLW